MTPPADVSGPPTAVIEMAEEITAVTTVGGRYELGQIVGRGGMSTVYRAVDRCSGQCVAVKVFRPGVELADSPARRRREVELASALHHPGVVAVLDAQVEDSDRADGCAYLVTEFVDGPTLGQRISLAPLTEQQIIELGATLCGTLAYVHAAGIVHRDIKPANVLLPSGADGLLHPKLTDFGIALMVDSTRMTATGFMAGTANYLSPEHVRGEPVTAASDVYALGLVLLEALTGRTVYAGHGIAAALARLHTDPQPPAGTTPALADVLTQMTARDPQTRPSAEATRRTFRRLLGDGLVSDVFALDAAPPIERPTRPSLLGTKPRRRTTAVAALAAVAAALTTVFLVLGGADRSGAGTAAHPGQPVAPTNPPAAPARAGAATAGAPTSNPATPSPTTDTTALVARHVAPPTATAPSHAPIVVANSPVKPVPGPPVQQRGKGKGKVASPPQPPKKK